MPLSYVVRANDAPDPTPNLDFLDDYVAMAPLVGETFAVDSKEVHTYIVKFITGNHVAESKIQPRLTDTNGRVDFKLLVAHYEGVGINSVDVLRAERIIETLHYSGEKKPHMWWSEFEIQLDFAFTALQKDENRQVYSERMKL